MNPAQDPELADDLLRAYRALERAYDRTRAPRHKDNIAESIENIRDSLEELGVDPDEDEDAQ